MFVYDKQLRLEKKLNLGLYLQYIFTFIKYNLNNYLNILITNMFTK